MTFPRVNITRQFKTLQSLTVFVFPDVLEFYKRADMVGLG